MTSPTRSENLHPDFGDLYANAPCGLLVADADGTIRIVNNTFLAWTGRTRTQLVGSRFVDLLSPGGRLYHETHYMPMLQLQSMVNEIAFEVLTVNRGRISVLVNARVERDEHGAIAAIHLAAFAATERREYERELMRAKHHAEEAEAHANLLAQTLQATLIPLDMPQIDDLDLGATYLPAGLGAEVGGDFYDVFPVSADEWVISIGDVCGKGVDAAIVTALVRYTIRAAAVEHPDAASVLRIANEVLLRHDTERFCTVALLRLRRSDTGWNVSMALGGHPSPLLRRHVDATTVTEPGQAGTLLGVFENVKLPEATIELVEGDALVLYTDGVTEGRRAEEFFGEDRLGIAILGAVGTAQEQAIHIAHEAIKFQSSDPTDDIAVVVVHVPKR